MADRAAVVGNETTDLEVPDVDRPDVTRRARISNEALVVANQTTEVGHVVEVARGAARPRVAGHVHGGKAPPDRSRIDAGKPAADALRADVDSPANRKCVEDDA